MERWKIKIVTFLAIMAKNDVNAKRRMVEAWPDLACDVDKLDMTVFGTCTHMMEKKV